MLVGRESERRTIATLLAGARVGDSRVLVLAGEPGIGKTTLLAEALTLVGGMRVLRAQGVESERNVPFAGLLQLLRPVLDLLEHVPRPQARALASALLLDGPSGPEPSRFAVGAATLSLLARAAEDAPLAVLVDDAHLLDSPSAEALVFAARRLVSDAVAVLVTARAGEPGAVLWASLPTLTVRGLDLPAAHDLLGGTASASSSERVARLHAATAGNPLGLLELGSRADGLDAPAQSALPVSEQLSQAFLGRAADLSEDAKTALLVAAVDSSSTAVVLAACSALGLAAPRLAEAEDVGLLTVRGDVVEFRHPLVRSAVYGAADADTRRAVHRAVASVLPPHQSDRLAWHLALGAVAPDEPTARTLDDVADHAAARGAYAIAADAHERAAGLSGDAGRRPARLAAAGEAAWLAGDTDRAVDLLARALAGAPDPLLRAHVREVKGAVETRCGSLEDALHTFTEAAADVEPVDPDAAVRLLADAVHVSFYLADPAAAREASATIDRLAPLARDPGTRSLGDAATGMALVLNGSGVAGVERLRRATDALVVRDDAPVDFRLPLRVQGALWLRDSGPHREVVARAIDRLRDQAALGSLPYLLMHIGRDAATTDRWDDADSAYAESIRLARETGQTTELAVSLAGQAVLAARRGRDAQCQEAVTEARPLCERGHIRLAQFWLSFAEGDLAAGRGDASGAAVHYEALESALAAAGLADADQSCAPELAEVYAHLGRSDAARPVVTRFDELARRKAEPWATARAERALGLLADDGTAGEHFAAALRLHALTPDRYETARTELAYGACLRRERRRTEARTLLRSALQTFERLGAAPWADRAALELSATGESARRRHASGVDQLTPQERQIAQLLAQGRTTRETAAALFISPKTVEYHLRHVYLKLEVRSRAALAEALDG